jgi:membrane-bound serine protease (ClpP class)
VLALALLRVMPRLPFGRTLILDTELLTAGGYASQPELDHRWLGMHGTAASTLRPAGVAYFDHERVDVVTEGEYIEADTPIAVVRVDGNRIVVRRLAPEGQRSES